MQRAVVSALLVTSLSIVGTPGAGASPGGAWSAMGTLKTPRTSFTVTTLNDGRVLAVGGQSAQGTVASSEIFDPLTRQWETTTVAPTKARYAHTATRLEDGTVLLAAGFGVERRGFLTVAQSLSHAELFFPATKTWRATGSLSVPRDSHTATLLGGEPCRAAERPLWCGQVLVAGGYTQVYALTGTAELYDPGLGVWRPTAEMIDVRAQHSATQLPDGRVLVAGGSLGHELGEEIYDPSTHSWTPTGALETMSFNHTATFLDGPPCRSASPAAWCGKVLVAGGSDNVDTYGGAYARSELYDPSTGKWSSCSAGDAGPACPAPMKEARFHHSAALLPDGRVLAVGGVSKEGGPLHDLNSAEIYDPATGLWTETTPAPNGGDLAMDLLPCGQILTAGRTDDQDDQTAAAAFTVPGLIADISASALSETDVELNFCTPSAPGAGDYDPGPAAEYVVKQSASPIDGPESFAAAKSLCEGGVCTFDPTRIGAPLTLSISDLAPGTTYYYAVRARGPDGSEGPISETVKVTTAPDTVAPAPVEDLKATALSATEIKLSFAAPGSNGEDPPPVGNYVVKQASSPIQDPSSFASAGSLCEGGICSFTPAKVGDKLELTVADLDPETTYHYAVVGVDDSGNRSPISNVASATTEPGDPVVVPDEREISGPPAAPHDLTAVPLPGRAVRLSFSAPGSNAGAPPPARKYVIKQSTRPIEDESSFEDARSLCGGPCAFSPGEVGQKLVFDVTDLSPKRTYFYAVRALDEQGNAGPLSNVASAVISGEAPGRIERLSARAVSRTKVRLVFSAPGSNGADGPPVERYVVKQARRPIKGEKRFAKALSLCDGVCVFSPKKVGDKISLLITDLARKTRYFYAVRPLDGSGNSGPISGPVRARTR